MDERSPLESWPFRVSAALVGLTLLGIVAQGLLAARIHPEASAEAAVMVEVAPSGVVAQSDVPERVAVLYRAAEYRPHLYEAIPCFCGCEAMLGHRHLRDCFVRADGTWEAHALGCGVCLGEARQVEDLVAAGVADLDRIREAVVARWGDPYQ
ncbi:MAG: PCYCGC motif-containing (lipo)protein [Acidimicrobiia bacterium]